MNPIKVAQIIPRLNEGGAERDALDLAHEHIKTGAAEHILISEGGRFASEAIKYGARFFPLPMASKNIFTAPRRILKLRTALSAIAPDIVHVRSRVPAWLHRFANPPLRIPTVSTVHGINSVNAYSKIMAEADAVICPGAAVAEHIKKYYGVDSTVIGCGVDLEYLNPAAVKTAAVSVLREQWDLSGKQIVLHVGRLSEQKGHEILLQALAKLPDEYAAVIAGGGRRHKRLAELARRLGIAERVRFAGARRDMREIYALADVVLSCAIKPESFGRSIAEALAMQKPVIAANHGGARDIITAEEHGGKLIPPGDADALAAALREPLPDASLSRARIATRFTAKKMADETLAVYKKVLAARRA
ncbi:MAG: glycosyltransferase family 4 protein [Betaproteobacteria bacterium]|nr:glycosyltransferase family 4 protein [Betaproteobacteria bacterium]